MSNQRVAVLIDADNIPASLCDEVLQTCKAHGKLIVKRAYGNFTNGSAKAWLQYLPNNSIIARLNLSVSKSTTGKNAADISLVVDAMKLSLGDKVDIFCIVSADSDFTRLAEHIREENKIVHAIGLKGKLTESFKVSCHGFKELAIPNQSPEKRAKELDASSDKPYLDAFKLTLEVLEELTKNNEWIPINKTGASFTAKIPNTKLVQKGPKKVSKILALVKETRLIELAGKGNNLKVRLLPSH